LSGKVLIKSGRALGTQVYTPRVVDYEHPSAIAIANVLSPAIAALATGDLLRVDPTEKTTLGIFVSKRCQFARTSAPPASHAGLPLIASDFPPVWIVLPSRASLIHRIVSGVIPGGYPSAALASNIAINDIITAVDGVSVTDDTLISQLKRARDAIGSKVKLRLDRNGTKHEVVLIRQRHSHVAQMEKITKLLSEVAVMTQGSPAVESLVRTLKQELDELVSMTAEGEAAVAEKIYQRQLKAQSHKDGKLPEKLPASAGECESKAQVDMLKEELQVAKVKAKTAEEAAKAYKVRFRARF